MRLMLNIAVLFSCLITAFIGCGPQQATQPTNTTPNTTEEKHVHAHDDELFWQSQNDEHEGFVLQLGHHGTNVFAAHPVEPAVSIEKDGKPVGDAKVFVAMLDSESGEVVGEEASLTYEPKTEEEPAHYAMAEFDVPKDIKSIDIRYRVEFSGDVAEFTKTITVPVDSH